MSQKSKNNYTIQPCRNDEQLRAYINEYWSENHILARDETMFSYIYKTPWVNREIFSHGTNVLCVYDEKHNDRLMGFIGAIATPYPRDQSFWLALWHVLPELKGTGLGGMLLHNMQNFSESINGWIGTFGAGPEALPIYLKRGYSVRAVRRWVFNPKPNIRPSIHCEPSYNKSEVKPNKEWIDYRYTKHPIYNYNIKGKEIFRTEENAWGLVTHCLTLSGDWVENVMVEHAENLEYAKKAGIKYLMDAWSSDCPGTGWTLAPKELPSVFHPPEARGNLIYASGRPFIPTLISKGDCDQDRPN